MIIQTAIPSTGFWAAFLTATGYVIAAIVVTSGAYLAFRFRQGRGHSIPNISMALRVRRTTRACGQKDDLILRIELQKREAYAVTLKDLLVQLFELKPAIYEQKKITPVSTLNPEYRSLDGAGSLAYERNVHAILTLEPDRALNLAPGESTQYESYSIVPVNTSFEIVATLTGIDYKRRRIPTRKRGIRTFLSRTSQAIIAFVAKLRRRSREPADENPPHIYYWTASTVSVRADEQNLSARAI